MASKDNALPYENTTAGEKAVGEMRKVLMAFGATSFGTFDDFDKGTLTVQFKYRERMIHIEVSFKGYATAWLKRNPWSTQRKLNRTDYERKALEQGQVSVYSILRDYVKAQVTMVECGILSLEGAFLGQILLPNGRTVLQTVEDKGLLKLQHHNAEEA